MDNLLEYYDFLLENAKVDEGVLQGWNERKLINEIKSFLNRFYNKAVLSNLKSTSRKEDLIKLHELFSKYESGDDSVKEELIKLGKSFLDKKNKAISLSKQTKYHG